MRTFACSYRGRFGRVGHGDPKCICNTHLCPYVCFRMCFHMYASICAFIYVHSYVCIHMCASICVHSYVCVDFVTFVSGKKSGGSTSSTPSLTTLSVWQVCAGTYTSL